MTTTTSHGQVPEALVYAELPDLDDTLWLAIGQHRRAITIVETSAAAKAVDAAVHSLLRAYADATHALRASHGQAPATQKLTEQICISDTNQSAACAVGNVGTTSDAQTTRSTHDAPATQQAGEVVAYLDIGAGGYLDLGSALSDEDLQQLPKGRHALVIAGTYGIDGYVAAHQPSPTAQAESVLEDAARWQWLADYLIGERTDLDEGIVACATIDALRQFADAARKQGGV